MRLSSRLVLSLLGGVCAGLLGCAGTDPFSEMSAAPGVPSSSYPLVGGSACAIRPPEAVPKPEEGPLSLARCVDIALRNNPQTRVSWQNALAAAARLGMARGLYLPQAEFNATAQRQQYQVLTEVEAVFLRTTYDASFGVRQLLLDGGSRRATVSAAEAALRGADFRHNSMLLDVALGTEVSYYRLLGAKSLLEVAEETVRQRTRHLELAQKRRKAGVGRLVEVLQANAEKADAELSVVESRHQVRDMRGRLASVMGLRVSTPLEIQDVPEGMREVEREDVERLLGEAARSRPTLQAAVEEVTRLRHALEAERAARWPELNASGSYGWRDTDVPPQRSEWSLSLGLRVPIFTGFQRTYRIAQARAQYEAARANYESRLRDVELDVWEAYSGVLRAEEAIKAAERFVESSRESVIVAEREYKEGTATIVELIDAQTALTRALNRKVVAGLDWHLALARLERAVGRSFNSSARTSQMSSREDAELSTPRGDAMARRDKSPKAKGGIAPR